MSELDHAEIVAQLGATHEKRLLKVLKDLEDQIAALVMDAPLVDGKLSDLAWATQQRVQIRQAFRDTFLKDADTAVREYDTIVKSLGSMYEEYGSYLNIDPEILNGLKSVSFQGFQDIGNTFADELANELYQNTLVGKDVGESVKSVRQKINGVYMTSDQERVNKLVKIAQGEGADAEAAASALRSIYATDRSGRNMRRYASQMVHDNMMQFDAGLNVAAGKEIGAENWKYYGSVINDSRKFCQDHAGQTYTEEEIRKIWAEQTWTGKAQGDPFIVRGGYNCRHHFRPAFSEETATLDEAPEQIKEEKAANRYDITKQTEVRGSFNTAVFNDAMNDLQDDQLELVNKLPPLQYVEKKRGGEAYYMGFRQAMVVDPDDVRAISTIKHEYGHHIDRQLGKTNNSGTMWWSSSDDGFREAFEQDRKAYGLHRSKTKDEGIQKLRALAYADKQKKRTIGGVEHTVTVNEIINNELSGFSDIIDALTHGYMQKRYGGFGHGVSYYKDKGNRYLEVFANLFALRSSPEWELTKKTFPNMTAVFEQKLRESLNG